MFSTLTKTWSLRAFGPSLQARSSLFSCLARKNASGRTTCPSDGPRLAALSAGLRMAEDIFAGAFMLTLIGRPKFCGTLGRKHKSGPITPWVGSAVTCIPLRDAKQVTNEKPQGVMGELDSYQRANSFGRSIGTKRSNSLNREPPLYPRILD